MLPDPLPGTPTAVPKFPNNRPAPAGYHRLEQKRVTANISAKAIEVRDATQYPIGSQFLITVDGTELLFAVEWHQHAQTDNVAPGLKRPHRGVTVYTRQTAVTATPPTVHKTVPNPAAPVYASGIDVSHFQPTINWKKAALSLDFAFIKATESTGIHDASFAHHWANADNAGILRGAYHFFHGDKDGATQADFFLRTMGVLDDGDLPPILDLEHAGGAKPDVLSQRVSDWIQTVETVTKRKPIIYTGPSFWSTHMGPRTDHFPYGEYPLWIAHYGVPKPSLPTDNTWDKWTFWQFSGKGTHPAVRGHVDLDRFNGSLLDLWIFLGASSDAFDDPLRFTVDVANGIFNVIDHAIEEFDDVLDKPSSKFDPPPLRFRIPGPYPPVRTYVVQPGDTLVSIATKNNVGMQDLARENRIPNPAIIRRGQVLRLP